MVHFDLHTDNQFKIKGQYNVGDKDNLMEHNLIIDRLDCSILADFPAIQDLSFSICPTLNYQIYF